MRWTKIMGYGQGYLGEATSILRRPGTKVRKAMHRLPQHALVRAQDPEEMLHHAALGVVTDVVKAELRDADLEGQEVHVLLTIRRVEYPRTMEVAMTAELLQVHDLDLVTRVVPPTIDPEEEPPTPEEPTPFTPNFTRF